jgi:hypothetical protein
MFTHLAVFPFLAGAHGGRVREGARLDGIRCVDRDQGHLYICVDRLQNIKMKTRASTVYSKILTTRIAATSMADKNSALHVGGRKTMSSVKKKQTIKGQKKRRDVFFLTCMAKSFVKAMETTSRREEREVTRKKARWRPVRSAAHMTRGPVRALIQGRSVEMKAIASGLHVVSRIDNNKNEKKFEMKKKGRGGRGLRDQGADRRDEGDGLRTVKYNKQ